MKVRTLLVMLPERQSLLARILKNNGMEVVATADFLEAQKKLQETGSYDLVLVDADLPGGSWKMLIESILNTQRSCEVIVCCRLADEQLWAEVLQYGVYDLIPEPYNEREVARIARCALDSQYLRRFGRAAAPLSAVRKAS